MDWWWSGLVLVLSFGLGHALLETLDVAPLRRRNVNGHDVPSGGGILAVFAVVGVGAVFVWVHSFDAQTVDLVPALIAILGFGAMGFFDDVVGTHSTRGLRGHVAAAIGGRLTSGAAKLVIGVALAAVIAPFYASDSWHRLLVVVVVAGSANAANLLDLAPARVTKAAGLVLVGLAVTAGARQAVEGGPAWMYAATLGLLPAELRERLMLGDAGANALGAVVGIAAVRACGHGTTALALAALVAVAINAAGELVSFSAVIDRVPPLRAIDRLGRKK